MAGTSWPALVAGNRVVASELESKFDWVEGSIAPMSNGSLTNAVHDLGTTSARWLNTYTQRVFLDQIRSMTNATTGIQIQNTGGTNVITIDTSAGRRHGIGTTTADDSLPTDSIELAGAIKFDVTASAGYVSRSLYRDNLISAWIFFNGTGTPSSYRSFNVTSITDGGVGNFRLNFTNGMINATYCSAGGVNSAFTSIQDQSTLSVAIQTENSGGAAVDATLTSVMCVGGQ